MEKSNQPEAVSSVLKVFNILSALAEQKEIGVSELSQRLMMSKATTYRFLQTMKTLGYVEQEGEADKYALTLKLFEVGAKALEHVDLIKLANREMETVHKVTQETLHLGALEENAIIYLHKIDSSYQLRMYSRIGRRNPLYSTAIGKVLMSEMPKEEVYELLKDVEFVKHTEKTHANIDQLWEELCVVREQLFGEDNEEQEPGLRCIAVPVYDRFDKAIAAVSMSFPIIRFNEEKKAEYVALLHTAARNISMALGCKNYPV